jgi:MFS family permease
MVRNWIGIIPALLIVHLPAAALLGPIGNGLTQIWDITTSQIIWLQVAFALAYTAHIPVGRFVTRIASDRFVFVLGFAIAVAASWLFFTYARDFVPAMVLLLIAGGATGAMIYPALKMVSPKEGSMASIALGLLMVLGWAGSVYVSQMASTVNLSALSASFPPGGGWNTIYLVTAVLGAIWLIPAFFLISKKATLDQKLFGEDAVSEIVAAVIEET